MQLKFLLYVFSAFLMLWLMTTAWQPHPDSFIVKGQIAAIKGKVANAKLKYTQNPNDFDFANMKSLDIRADGTFQGTVNIKPHGTVYFYVFKNGYTKAREARVLKEGDNDLGRINICKLFEQSGYRAMRQADCCPRLKLYKDECLTAYDDMVGLEEILYFEDIETLRLHNKNCGQLKDALLLSAKLNLKGEQGPNAYFALELFNQAHLQSANPSAPMAASGPVIRGTLLSDQE